MWSERSEASSLRGVTRTCARVLAVWLVLMMLVAPVSAQDGSDEEQPPAGSQRANEVGEITFDILVLRTLGAVQTAVGFTYFLVAGPLSAPGGGWLTAWDVFVMVPYEETFQRPLGRF